MNTMPRNGFRTRVTRFATYMSGLRDCAASIESGRKPSRSALTAIGLDPQSFDGLNFR